MSGLVPGRAATATHSPNRLLIGLGLLLVAAVAVVAFVAYGAGSPGSTPRQKLDEWVRGTGFGSSVGTLQADDARIAEVVRQHRGAGALHADCGVLYTDTAAANTELPAPDSGLTTLLSDAYTLEGKAANECYGAASSPRLQAESAADRSRALALLSRAVSRVHAVTGGTVSTTTTTQPAGGGILG